jgi:hypothetical protein
MRIKLNRVHYLPNDLKPGILYVSDEYGIAAHLCPCGCGSKVITPLGPAEWKLKVTYRGPTLYPSIGNWQLPCKSHYWITEGRINWSRIYTKQQIEEVRQAEENRLKEFEEMLSTSKPKCLLRFIQWIISKLGR